MNPHNLSSPLLVLFLLFPLTACFADPAPSSGDPSGETGDGDGDGDEETGTGDGGDGDGDGDGDGPCTTEGCDCSSNDDICEAGLYCSPAGECTAPVCGDGELQPLEECDDGNDVDGDGCDADCTRTEVLYVDAGGESTCVLLEGGHVRCWGANNYGQLGYGHTNNIGDDETPASVGNVMLPEPGVELSVGSSHSCILMSDMAVRCWGQGDSGQLGYGNTNSIGDDEYPVSIMDVSIGGAVLEIDAGDGHSCARLDDGKLRCWGHGGFGELGYGNTDDIGDDETPAAAGDVPVGAAVTAIATGAFHTCAVTAGGTVRCWGRYSAGRLGYGGFQSVGDDEPVSAVGDVPAIPMGLPPTTKATAIAVGNPLSCALYETGDVLCWGAGFSGALGQGTTDTIGDNETPSTLPPVSLPAPAVAITAGPNHVCALLDNSQAVCWGSNAAGELGYGNTENVGDDETPDTVGTVQLGGPIKQIDAGGGHTCAIMSETNEVVCWGANNFGQLGYGHTDNIGDDELPVEGGPIALF